MTDSLKDVLHKAANFCAYQERTQREVRQRLREWDTVGDEAEEIIAELISQNFLNEERFAKAFAGGKFRVKHWGRIKIKQELQMRGLSSYNIRVGLAEIEDTDYHLTLQNLLDKKSVSLNNNPPLVRKQKLARYAIGKGFEAELVWEILSNTQV